MTLNFRDQADGHAGLSGSKITVNVQQSFNGDSQAASQAIRMAITTIQAGGTPKPLSLSEIANHTFDGATLHLKANAQPNIPISERTLVTIGFPEGQRLNDEQITVLMDCVRDQSLLSKPKVPAPKTPSAT